MTVCVVLHLAGWVKIKYLHLIKWGELNSPGQDRVPVPHCWWNRVGNAQDCIHVHVTVFISKNDDIIAKIWR